jgi:hypothetical protein
MPKEDGYNGYANYATWCVALWVDNEEGSQAGALEMAREAFEVAEDPGTWGYPDQGQERAAVRILEERLKHRLSDVGRPKLRGMYSDLLGWALESVDWQELAEHWLEAAREGVE